MDRHNILWTLLLFVGIVGVLWVFLRGTNEEGFLNPFRHDEEAARAAGRYSTYFEDKTDYFHKQLSNKAIFANADTVSAIPDFPTRLQSALETAMTGTSGPPDPEYYRFVHTIQNTDPDRVKFDGCNSILRLEDLPTGSDATCGWLFKPDT